MKKNIYVIVGLIALVIGQSVLAQQQTISAETQGPVSIEWYSASLPRESSGASWPVASTNWMNAIRTEQTTGAGRVEAKRIDYCDYPGMVTTASFSSWKATADTSSDFGNRQHFGFKLSTQSGYFIPASINYTIRTEVWNGVQWIPLLFPDVPSSMAIDNNSFRQRLNAGTDGVYGTTDDVVSGSQLMGNQTNGFIYGGYGIGVGVFVGGNNQQQLDGTLLYLRDKKLRVIVTVVVPYSNGTSYTFKTIYLPLEQFMPPQKDPNTISVVYNPLKPGETHSRVSWINSGTAQIYEVQKSADLSNWTHHAYTDQQGCDVMEEKEGAPKGFYRLRAW
jgi:hypothetical protein